MRLVSILAPAALVVAANVTFPTTWPEPTAAATVSPMEAATAYAAQHGLTDCGESASADLDDVFLTLDSDPSGVVTNPTVHPVDLDTALASAGKRVVVLACTKETS